MREEQVVVHSSDQERKTRAGRQAAPAARSPHRPYLLGIAFAVLLAWGMCAWVRGVAAQEQVDQTLENTVKVAYLYGFGRYVEWPEGCFAAAPNRFVIGVVGGDPTGGLLEELARKKTLQNRTIAIVRADDPPTMIACHILYVPAVAPESLQVQALQVAANRPVLTVGEAAEFLSQGGVIRFFRQAGSLHFSINPDAAKMQGVTIDAKLLSLSKPDSR
jgi:hypothetical protein